MSRFTIVCIAILAVAVACATYLLAVTFGPAGGIVGVIGGILISIPVGTLLGRHDAGRL